MWKENERCSITKIEIIKNLKFKTSRNSKYEKRNC